MYMGNASIIPVTTVNTSITPIWPTWRQTATECTQSENVRAGAAGDAEGIGLNYEKRHTKQGIQTNLTLKRKATATGCQNVTTLQQPDPLTHLTGICRSFFIPESPEGENPLFTLHRIFTRYHTEIKRENER